MPHIIVSSKEMKPLVIANKVNYWLIMITGQDCLKILLQSTLF